MDPELRQRIVRQRAVAKSSLTRLQNFLASGEHKVNELQVRYDELPVIYNKYDSAQSELEISDDDDHLMDREAFEEQYYGIKAKLLDLLHPIETLNGSLNDSNISSASSSSYIRLPTIEIPTFTGDACQWLHFRDTFQALIIDNKVLSDIQRFHYLTSSLKDEARQLIVNLPISSDNFTVAWNLVSQRYNNVKLIAMKHVKQLVQMPQVKSRDAASLRQLINHVSSHTNALKALNMQVSLHDLMLNHLMLSVLDIETHKEWELHSAKDQDIPSIGDIIEFLEDRCKAMELLQASQAKVFTPTPRTTQTTKVSQPSRCNLTTQSQCPSCKGSHGLYYCQKFRQLQPQQRLVYAKQVKACFNCLQPFSRNHKCSNGTCRKCGQRHNTLLHVNTNTTMQSKRPTQVNNSVKVNPPTEVNTYCSFKGTSTNQVLLATAIVEIKNKFNQYVPCRVLLDNASQLNFISESCVQRLRLPRKQQSTSIQGINNVNTTTNASVSIHLRSRHSDWHSTVSCAVLPHVTSDTPAQYFDVASWNIPRDFNLADEHFNQPGPIDLLIGAELFYELLLPNRQTRQGYPVLQETVLGWIVSGKTPITTVSNLNRTFLIREHNLETNLNRFWEVEPVEQTMTPEQQACENHFLTHTTQQSDERFVVRLPLKGNPNQLGTSRRLAENRLLAIERRLERNAELKEQYHKFMHEYEDLGHMEPVTSTALASSYYLPHHAVFKETSTTTRTRVVFDGGAKSSNGLSLNDILLVGPTVQPDLYSIVLRFRTHQVCFLADIAKMYRQILVHPRDRDLQRILWRYSPNSPVQEYQLTTVTYGTSSAPYLATRCLKKLADDNVSKYPRAAQVLNNDFYVDDLLSGTTTINEAIQLQQELTTLLQSAGFTLRKWASNEPAFLATIPEDQQETQSTVFLDSTDGVTTLGLLWDPRRDHLQVRNNSSSRSPQRGDNSLQTCTGTSSSTASTKRQVLSAVASIFDPLGLLSPSVVVYKIFLQQLWQDHLQWDEQLTAHLQQTWNKLQDTIPGLSPIRIPRKVICADVTNIQIHGFCDSSEQAYGACLYIRSTNENNQVFCELLCSTSKVAPLKRLTIPRLELCAAVLLAKLFRRVTRALTIEVHKSYLWTDSTIVLAWIQGASNRWKTFVGNRVALIQEATSSATWHHVPTQHNPADLISRGTDPTFLSTSTLWWHGPQWILQESSSWPSPEAIQETTVEMRSVLVTCVQTNEDFTQKFSKLNRLIRVTAFCRRFIYNCRQSTANRQTSTLNTQDLDQALTCCVKMAQQTSYAQEVIDLLNSQEVSSTSSLKTLHPFIDQEGLIRVGGRLQQSALPFHTMHPIILHPNHHFTRLVISAEHIRLHHAGPQLLIASLRERYWIPRIKNVVKTIIHQCLPCYRFKAQAAQQLMGELPSSRVQPSRPFYTSGIDYAGPILLKLGPPRSKVTSKGYIAIFVCFVTKAIHLEVVTSLSTEGFLAALRRFIARRGRPRTIYSDNGTNFKGAANQLHHIYTMLQSSSQMATVQDFLSKEGCDWKFIPPHGPHFGGLWEAAVKSMKHHLRRTLRAQIATYEELYTLLTEIETCLNSRPLCTLSNDPHESSYLSPGHFLIGEPLTQLPSVDYTNVKCNRLSRWQSFQQQLQTFWQRWSADYLNELQQRQRWCRSSPNMQPGDVVLLREDNTTPLQWPTAIITAVHPGADNKTRVVTVKTPYGEFKRPIAKICSLPQVNSEL